MANVTKLSVSLPTPVADALKREADERGIPLSQLLSEALQRRTQAAAFADMLDEVFGPFTDADREAGHALFASAQTPDEILDDA